MPAGKAIPAILANYAMPPFRAPDGGRLTLARRAASRTEKRTFFRQAFVIFDRDNDIDGFSHAARFTYLAERSVSITH